MVKNRRSVKTDQVYSLYGAAALPDEGKNSVLFFLDHFLKTSLTRKSMGFGTSDQQLA